MRLKRTRSFLLLVGAGVTYYSLGKFYMKNKIIIRTLDRLMHHQLIIRINSQRFAKTYFLFKYIYIF